MMKIIVSCSLSAKTGLNQVLHAQKHCDEKLTVLSTNDSCEQVKVIRPDRGDANYHKGLCDLYPT